VKVMSERELLEALEILLREGWELRKPGKLVLIETPTRGTGAYSLAEAIETAWSARALGTDG
jgi:hypothetical protein